MFLIFSLHKTEKKRIIGLGLLQRRVCMPDKSGPDDKKTEPRRFISEKIVKQPRTKRDHEKGSRPLLTAALFGIVAAVTFVVSRPVAEKYLGKETTRGDYSGNNTEG